MCCSSHRLVLRPTVERPTPVGEPMQLERPGPSRRPWLAVAAAAVMLVGVGSLIVLTTRNDSTDRAASVSSPSASSPVLSDTGDTVPLLDANWEEAVAEVLNQMGWPVAGLEHIPGDGEPYADSVVAFVGEGRIMLGVRTYSDGEYSDDVAWQMAVAGSNSPGTPIVGGPCSSQTMHRWRSEALWSSRRLRS